MTQPNELRIGNYFEPLLGGLTAVTSISREDFKCHDFKSDVVKPIPLTEDWLLKLGWVWNEECKSFEKYPNGDVRMNLQFREVSNSYTMFNYVLKATIAERIYYVHQLQNLYFALTGDELTIK